MRKANNNDDIPNAELDDSEGSSENGLNIREKEDYNRGKPSQAVDKQENNYNSNDLDHYEETVIAELERLANQEFSNRDVLNIDRSGGTLTSDSTILEQGEVIDVAELDLRGFGTVPAYQQMRDVSVDSTMREVATRSAGYLAGTAAMIATATQITNPVTGPAVIANIIRNKEIAANAASLAVGVTMDAAVTIRENRDVIKHNTETLIKTFQHPKFWIDFVKQ